MDDDEKLNRLQEYLTEEHIGYMQERKRKVTDSKFAKYLGVSTASYNQWVNGNRMPSYDNVIKIAARLGPEIFDIMGYDRIAVSNNPDIMLIVDSWRYLDNETREQIIDHITSEMSKRSRRA